MTSGSDDNGAFIATKAIRKPDWTQCACGPPSKSITNQN